MSEQNGRIRPSMFTAPPRKGRTFTRRAKSWGVVVLVFVLALAAMLLSRSALAGPPDHVTPMVHPPGHVLYQWDPVESEADGWRSPMESLAPANPPSKHGSNPMSSPQHCPHCLHTESKQVETRYAQAPEATRRVLQCKRCEETWVTFEVLARDFHRRRAGPVIRFDTMTKKQAGELSIRMLDISNQIAEFAAGNKSNTP